MWTHYLKGFEFLKEYTMGEYKGPAARIGAALEAWEGANAMVAQNVTVVVPLDQSVGYGGGWQLGGGHGPLTSYRGLGADQILSLNVVTADGRFVTADLNQNTDLFFALRGGGGSKHLLWENKRFTRRTWGAAPRSPILELLLAPQGCEIEIERS